MMATVEERKAVPEDLVAAPYDAPMLVAEQKEMYERIVAPQKSNG